MSVVTLRRGYMPAPIFLRHPVAEVKIALDIIFQERRKGRMLAFAGQAPLLGAHYLSDFVAHSLSGSKPSPRRVDEPGSDAARSADGSV